MAREDFYLTFGSDAEKFGGRLAKDLRGARSELGQFAAEAQEIEDKLRRMGGQGQFSRLITSIGEANALIQDMVEGLTALKAEFQQLAGSMKTIAKGAGTQTGRPAPGTPDVPTSHAGRVSPTAQADAGRVEELPAKVRELGQTLVRNYDALAQADRELKEATDPVLRQTLGGQKGNYSKTIKRAEKELREEFGYNQEQIELLRQHDYERVQIATDAANQTQTTRQQAPRKQTTRKTTAKAPAQDRIKDAGEGLKQTHEQIAKIEADNELAAKSMEELIAMETALKVRRGEIATKHKSGKHKGTYVAKPSDDKRYSKELAPLKQQLKDIDAERRRRSAERSAQGPETKPAAAPTTGKSPVQEQVEQVVEQTERTQKGVAEAAQSALLDEEAFQKLIAARDAADARRKKPGVGQKSPGGRGHKTTGWWEYARGPEAKAAGGGTAETKAEFQAADEEYKRLKKAAKEQFALRRAARESAEGEVSSPEEETEGVTDALRESSEDEKVQLEQILNREDLKKAERLDLIKDAQAKFIAERGTIAHRPGDKGKYVPRPEFKGDAAVEARVKEISKGLQALGKEYGVVDKLEDDNEVLAEADAVKEASNQQVQEIATKLGPLYERRRELLDAGLMTAVKRGRHAGTFRVKGGDEKSKAEGRALNAQIRELEQQASALGAKVSPAAEGEAPKVTDEVGKGIEGEASKVVSDVQSILDMRSIVKEQTAQAIARVQAVSKQLDTDPALAFERPSDQQRAVMDEIEAAGGKLASPASRQPLPAPSTLIDPGRVAQSMVATRDVLGEDVAGLKQLISFLQSEQQATTVPQQKEDIGAYIQNAQRILGDRQQLFERVDQSEFARGLDVLGMNDEALEQLIPRLDARAEAITQEIQNVDAGLYKGMGAEAAGRYRDDLTTERSDVRAEKKRALDARQAVMSDLIQTFPVEALAGLDEGALNLPESLQGKFAQYMGDRGTPLATAPVRRLLGEATSIQRLPDKWRKGAVGATGDQEHDPLRMMAEMPAYTPGQADTFRAALNEQARLTENNQGVAEERMQLARTTISELLEALPELSLSELRTILSKSTGISKEARNSLLAAARFVDELTILNPGTFSPARVAGAEKRHGSREISDMRFEDRRAEYQRKTGDTGRLNAKQRRKVHEKDLRGAFYEAFYDDRQVSGDTRGLTERTFRLFDEGGLEGLQSRARTPQQKDALKIFQDRMQQGLGVAVKRGAETRKAYKAAGLTPTSRDPETGAITETDLEQALAGAESDEQRAKIQALIERKKKIEQQETAWLKDIRDRWEDLENTLAGSLDPEAQERIERLNQERRDLARAREEVGLPSQPPSLRSFRVPHEGELAERMGAHRPRVDPEAIAEAKAKAEEAQADLSRHEGAKEGLQSDITARAAAYEELSVAAERAADVLKEAEQAPAPASERTQQLTAQQQALEQFERDEIGRRQQGERTLKPDLVAAAEGAGIPVKSRMTKDDLSAALAERKGVLGREVRESRRQDLQGKVIPPELADEARRLSQEANTAKTELDAARRALQDFYTQLRHMQGAASGHDRQVMELRGEDHSTATDEQHRFEKLNDAIRRVEAEEITETKQIPQDIRDAQGIADHGEDLAMPLRQMQTARHAMMMGHMGQYMDFDPQDPRFKSSPENIAISPEEMYARFDDFAREVQGSVEAGRTPDDAAREDLTRQEAAEEPHKEQLDIALARVQQERAAEEARRAQTRGGGMGDCCDRLVSILERIHQRLVAGLRITGQGRGGSGTGLTRDQMVDVARAGGVKGYSKMRKGELEENLRSAGLLEKAEQEQLKNRKALQQMEEENASLTPDFLRRVQRDELPSKAQGFLADRRDAGDLVPDKAIDNAAKLVGLLKESGYHQDDARRVAQTQLGLTEKQSAQLRERLVRLRAESRGTAGGEADANRERERGARLYQEQLDILRMLTPETQRLAMRARELNQRARTGKGDPAEAEEASILAVEAMEREMKEFRTPDGRVALPGGERNTQQAALIDSTAAEFNQTDSRRKARDFRDTMQTSLKAEAPHLQKTVSNMLFGGRGFMERIARSTGTFIVRNMTAGMVFGLTRKLRELVKEAIHTEAQFIRVSDALEATGRSAAGVRTALMRISVDIGRPLEEIYEIAGNITGAFDDVRDVEFGTRIVAQLELISDGALKAKDGFDALQTIAAAFELEGVRELERIQNTAVAIQNVMAIGVDDTVQGIGGLAGIAKEMNFELEETAVLVAAVAKGTNQGGKAAAEQFGRILSTFETQRGRNVLLEAGVGELGMFQEGEVGAIVFDLIRGWDDLTEAQQANIKATYGSRREARAFNALINRREQILQTLIETENAYGLGQRRVEEVMREIANQTKIAGTNFTNFGAVLVRSGVANFFGVMLRGFNATMSTVNEFLSVLNDLADANPLTRFARDAIGVLGGLALTMKVVGLVAQQMWASLAMHAARDGSLQAVSQTSVAGRRIHAAAAKSGATAATAGGAAATTAATRNGMLTGIALGAARPRGRVRSVPGGGVSVGRNTQMTQQQAVEAGYIDPVTGLLIAHGIKGIAPKITRGAGRGMQGAGQRLLTRGAAPVRGFGAAGATLKASGTAKAGAAMTKLGAGIATLSTATAWAAVGVVSALGAAIYGLFRAAGNREDMQQEAFNLLAPFMDEGQLKRFEEQRRNEDRGWLQQIGEFFRGPDDEERRRRKAELDAMLPGERLLSQEIEDRDWADEWFGNPQFDFANAFGVNWGSIDFSKWFTGDVFEDYEPPEDGQFERAILERYEEEGERLLREMRTGRQIQGVPDAARGTVEDFANELDEIISVDDAGVISVQDVDWLSDDKDTRLEQIERIRGEMDDTIAATAANLERAREAGEIDEAEFAASSAALVDIRQNAMRQIDQLYRQTLGLSDINELTGEQLEEFVAAMGAIEGVSIPQMAAVPELQKSFDLLFDGMVDEDSSWQRMIDAMTNDQLSGFERAEAFQRARRDTLAEAQRQLEEAQAEPNTSEEDMQKAEQAVFTATQAAAQGQQELWDLAVSQASDMAALAVELGGGSVAVAERTILKAINAVERQMDALPQDSVEYWQKVQDLQNLYQEQVSIETADLQRDLEMLRARGGDPYEVASEELGIARQLQALTERKTRHLNPRVRAALMEAAEIQVAEAERGFMESVEARADALVSLLQARTDDPLEQAQIGLTAALAAQTRAYARGEQDVATLQRLEQDIIEERRRVRDSIEAIRRSEMELGLSQTQDPRERALIELRDATAAQAYYQGNDPAERNARLAAVNNARQGMLEAMRADRDAVAQTSIAMERDPEIALLMQMELGRIQLTEAAEQGTAAYEAARQNLVQLEQQLTDHRNQIRLQQFSTRIATTEDPVRQAQLQVERAREEMRQAVGQLERTAAHEGIITARQAEADAIMAVAQSQLDLASAIAQSEGDQVKQAQIQLEAARMALRQAKDRGMGDAAVAQARAQVIQAESGVRDAVLQDHLDTIDFNREMGVITQAQAIQALQTILQEQELTRDQRRSLLRQIRGLQDDLRAQLTGSGFNIPTEIDLPTAYMVRRSLGLDEIDRDSVPDEWRELTLARTDIDEDLTKPLSSFTEAVSDTNDEVVRLVREGADAAIDTILAEYNRLGPLMNTSLQSIAQAQLDAWNAAEAEAGNGATSTNALSLSIISQLPPAMQSELARIGTDLQAMWSQAGDISEAGVRDLNARVGSSLVDGVNAVAQISHGFMVGIAAGIEPLLEALGLEGLNLPSSPPTIHGQASRGSGGGSMFVAAKGGFGPGEERLPATARIEQPHGTSGLVQWAEQSTHGEAFIPLSPANRPRSIDIWQETGRRLGVDLQQFRVGGFTSRDISRARAFAMNQAGKPYQWGGVGPGGYDCSGIWSAVVNKLNDSTNAHRRLFATSSFVGQPPAGFERGLGLVSVGVVQGNPGHMSGTLAGLDVESRGSRGVLVGNEARGATDSLYPAQYYLAKGGGSGEFGDDWFNLPEIPDFPDNSLGAVGYMVAQEVKRRVQEALRNKIQEAFGLTNLFAPGGSENESGTLQGMVQRALAERGWSQHWPALNSLIQNESSWNPNGQNPNSTAYGLFQFLDSTWAGTGIEKTNDPRLQIEAGLRYITNRYGDPTKAWQHWQARVPINGQDVGHWYAKGGIFDDPQMIGVGESGPEAVIPLDQRGARFLSQLLDETAVRAAVRSGGADMTAQQFLRDLGSSLATTNTNVGDTRVNIENTFNQTVQSPVQIQQIAQAVVDLLGKQMSGSARGSMTTPHLVRM